MSTGSKGIRNDLRQTLLATGVIAVVGGALLVYGSLGFSREYDSRQSTVDQANLAQAKVRQLQNDLATQQTHYPRYRRLKADDIVGALPKTVAIDRFEALVESTGVPLRNFTLDGRLPITLPMVSGFSTYEPSNHQMRFEATPLHEEELIRLTAELHRSLGGLHALEGCVINRSDPRSSEQAMATSVPRLSVRCTINWYVFAEVASDPSVANGPGMASVPAPMN